MGDWISVDERLPEDSGWYLVWMDSGAPHVYWWWDAQEEWAGGENDCAPVTHWMPLPEQPMGVE